MSITTDKIILRTAPAQTPETVTIQASRGTPQGMQPAELGSVVIDADTGDIWTKRMGDGNDVGWQRLQASGSGGMVTPLVFTKDAAEDLVIDQYFSAGILRWQWRFAGNETLALDAFDSTGASIGTLIEFRDGGDVVLGSVTDLFRVRSGTVSFNDTIGTFGLLIINKGGGGSFTWDWRSGNPGVSFWQDSFASNEDRVFTRTGVGETLRFRQADRGVQIMGASTWYSGSGVPAAGLGNNGDFYMRDDGAPATALYYKSGGAWAAIA